MPRIRYIKSEFWKDEDIAELPYEIRLFYIGMWNFADKAGRLEDRPKWLKVEIFPYDDIDVGSILQKLSNPKNNSMRPFIQRYFNNGKKYIQILSWDEHQRPHHQEQESKIPEPPILTETLVVNGNGECSSNKPYEDETKIHRTNTEDINDRTKQNKYDFETIWSKYPSGFKIGKQEALVNFNNTVKTDKDYKNINKAICNYKDSKRVKGGFIKDGCNFFKEWKDWVDHTEVNDQSVKPRQRTPSTADTDKYLAGIK